MRSERRKEYDKKYYEENKDSIRIKTIEYYKKNSEKIKECSNKHYHKNKDKNRELYNKRSREAYLKNRDKKLAWHKQDHMKRRIELLERLSGCQCKHCGYKDWRALQIDHVNGDGYKERGKTRKQQYEMIFKNPERYQVLCANCNWIKKYENKEHSKKRL